ncbi:MAG: hypothetical protein L0Y45_11640 [Woeseiaceae bacterium]|nr:hypothetical protein [Woeseiaceae bacterium]
MSNLRENTIDECRPIDVINDGEMSTPSYATYIKDRPDGFGGKSPENYEFADLAEYPYNM